MRRLVCVAVIFGVATSGCKTAPSISLGSRLPRTVVVLPFANETTSLDGAERMRRMVAQRIDRSGLSIEAVDKRLKGIGITDGGQLRAVTPAKLGDALGADGLVYGVLEEFKYQNVGFARRKVVKLSLKLIDAASGDVLWEATGRHANSKVALNPKKAKRAFIRGIAEQAAQKLLRAELLEESRRAVQKVLRTYPRR